MLRADQDNNIHLGFLHVGTLFYLPFHHPSNEQSDLMTSDNTSRSTEIQHVASQPVLQVREEGKNHPCARCRLLGFILARSCLIWASAANCLLRSSSRTVLG